MSEFNVDKYRDPDECRSSWNLRRRFLLAHHEKFSEPRLVCLAQCFVNVELFGNKYPDAVMVQLNQLGKDIPELVEERKERTKSKFTTMKFVKSTPEGSGADNPISGFVSPPRLQSQSHMGFVKSDGEYHSTDIHSSTYQNLEQLGTVPSTNARAHFIIDGAPPKKKSKKKPEVIVIESNDSDQTFALLRHQLKQIPDIENPISMLNMALQKTKNVVKSDFKGEKVENVPMFTCEVEVDGIKISSGYQANKKAAKRDAYEKVVEAIKKPYHLIVVNENGVKELQASDTSFNQQVNDDDDDDDLGMLPNGELTYETNAINIGITNIDRKNRRPNRNGAKDLNELIFFENTAAMIGPTGLLRQSADFSKMLIEYDYGKCDEGVSCRITLEGQPLVECPGESKQDAKTQASENAVDLLKKMCWTIKVKQVADSDSTSLSKEEIIGDVEKSMCEIPDSNVGNKLLRKMGWVGGGVGKDGTGRAEPVTLEQVVNREGLGLDAKKGISGDFKGKIRKIVDNYASSDNCDDLVFAPNFTKEERAIIHQHSQRLGLKTHSHGSGEERYLVISRKRSPQQLFQHIMSKGGSTSKYELVPPQR